MFHVPPGFLWSESNSPVKHHEHVLSILGRSA